TWAGYEIGRFILNKSYPDFSWTMFKNFSYKDLWNLYYPLFLGSVILGITCAVFFYFLTYWIVMYKRKKKLERLAAQSLKTLAVFIFVLIVTTSVIAFTANAEPLGDPIEKLVYKVSPVGKAEYIDYGLVQREGQTFKFATFTTQAMGLDDVEKIYSDPETFLPIRVERNVNWWLSKEYLVEYYDQKNFTLLIEKFIEGKKVKEYTFKKDGPIHNAVILPFYLRSVKDLTIGWTFAARVPDDYTLKLVSIENIRVPLGRFETYHFIGDQEKVEIWISTDSARIPVKIKGKNGAGYILYLTEHTIKQK
ncbi:MAG: DUF2062 domain-containing protein, partial [Candidatus Omnitrophica bacterium]|nr:DUF2062 domain-containing protein [Candidatus Omnitrophota bacterium]